MAKAIIKRSDPTPALIEKARELLASAKTLDEILHVRGIAMGAEEFFRAAKNSWQTAQKAAELRLRAERKAGQKLIEMGERKERLSGRGGDRKSKPARGFDSLADLDIDDHESSRWQQLARIAEKIFEAYIRECIELEDELTTIALLRLIRDETRRARRKANQDLVEQATGPLEELTPGIYSTVVIDPPWDWGDEGDVDQFGRATPTYATMPLDEIEACPVADLAAPDAHLYLWITNRSLPKGFGLLEAWGFRYVTMLTWCKPSIGMGNYFRGSTEHVLFGVRGSLSLLVRDQGTYFMAPRAGSHSTKPPEFYELVERCSPGPYLEMFARQTRKGWQPWGAES